MKPLVTIGLPVYNAERYLVDCIESIKAQTLKEFVVLAVLDGPTDRSAEILRQHADSRFEIIENPKNMGLAYTGNLLLNRCRTELLARMDSDDVMWPNRLQVQYEFMHAHPGIAVCGGYYDIVDEHGKRTHEPYRFSTDPEGIREEFRCRSPIHHPTAIYRAEMLKQLGGFSSDVAEDNVLWLKALAHGLLFSNVPEIVCSYRVHSTQMMSRLREPSLKALDNAYAEFGPKIWGNRAPDFVSGATRMERMKRRIKRKLSSLFS